jgi:hypothetical protein
MWQGKVSLFWATPLNRATNRFGCLICCLLLPLVALCDDALPRAELGDRLTEAGSLKYAEEITKSGIYLVPGEKQEVVTYLMLKDITDVHFVNLINLLCVGVENRKERSEVILDHSKRLESILRTSVESQTWDQCIFCLAQAFEAPEGGAELEKRTCAKIGELSPEKQIIAIDAIGSTRWVDQDGRMANLKSLYSHGSTTHDARVEILEAACTAAVQRWILPITCLTFYVELAELPQHSPSLTKQMLARMSLLIRFE